MIFFLKDNDCSGKQIFGFTSLLSFTISVGYFVLNLSTKALFKYVI